MAEILAGTIDQMSLLEILKFLNSGKMSGRLEVTNKYSLGDLYVKDGQIIHCDAGASTGESALATMLGWMEGKFKFEDGIKSPEESITKSTDQLFLDCAKKINEWQDIKKVVTSRDDIFSQVDTF